MAAWLMVLDALVRFARGLPVPLDAPSPAPRARCAR